ncbi:AraC family transcriptional regulator [Methylocapsa aurea]|uniref:AraC family transcriptional regulator n=1 Tax=Methylocapsa aurea TaxID=663610 RepID=UPI000565C253|nr:AraC family transcriptional regulator [Methylocapsa aurea]
MLDHLSEMLQAIRIESSFCGRAELTAPWSFRHPGSADARFYVFLEGAAAILLGDRAEAVAIGPGDYVMLPHGAAHILQDSALSRIAPFDASFARSEGDRRQTLRFGGGGRATAFISGYLRIDRLRGKQLLDILPPLLHLRAGSSARHREIGGILAEGAAEIESAAPGSVAVLNRLSELFFIRAVRGHFSEGSDSAEAYDRIPGSPQVVAALRLIGHDPAAQWTVGGLARRVGMSRSGFAAAFSEAMGQPPMRYVADQRMLRAAELLKSPTVGITQIASETGYGSDIAFGRVFKRRFGITPGAYRRAALTQAEAEAAAVTDPAPPARRLR